MSGGSYIDGKAEVCSWIREHYPDAVILDVGPGSGTWRDLLPEYKMDAVEIYTPYADRLQGYRKVFATDIVGMRYKWYNLIIFGDVIEHIEPDRARKALQYASKRCQDVIIAVPWQYKQGEVDGNVWQAHIQDDLTPEIFDQRYPGYEVLCDTGNGYCYYHKRL